MKDIISRHKAGEHIGICPVSTAAVDTTVGDLPDINVWVALNVPGHIHHAAAQTYWRDTAHETLWFCRHSSLGLMRLLCQPAMMGDTALRPEQALAAYQEIRAQSRIGLLADPPGLEERWAALAASSSWPPRMWPDAYLAALAQTANLQGRRVADVIMGRESFGRPVLGTAIVGVFRSEERV